jgi:long-chain acyl-CoA synthetase
MLSHRNILSNVNSILAMMPVHEDDVLLSFLPLSHTFERTVGYYLPIASGASVVFARSIALLMQDLVAIKPTILVSVPRIYERAYVVLRETMDRSWLTKRLFALAVEIGWRQFEHGQGRASSVSLPGRLLLWLLDRLVGKPLRARFGGRLRAAVTGGAALAPDVARPFLALGVPLLQGYGMTESAPVIACNTLEDNDPASVGRPVRGVAVRIGDHDELLAQGPNVMVGYWQRPTETAAAVDPDGWLHTGDQAQLNNGRIYIKGRIKDIIVTSTGEKIAPADLETAIGSDPMFDQVMVLGERRPYLAALVVLNPSRWAQQAEELGLNPQAVADLRSGAATHWVLERIGQALRAFPKYVAPRAVWLSLEPWTVGAGLITPTLKPKRAAIEGRYAAEIAELYRGH